MSNDEPGHDHNAESHDHDGHGHEHHGHENDQGIKGALRYLRWLPKMWSSEINDAVVDLVAPQSGEHVLDIGAGIGAGVMRAAASGAHVTAVEPTPIIRRGLQARRLASKHRSSIDVVDGAAEQLPVKDRSIDAIWAVNTMHHWLDPAAGAAEIARVLRPEGRLHLVDEVFTDPTHPEFEDFGADHGPEHHGFTLVEADEMGALLTKAGLTNVEASNEPIAGRPAIQLTANGAAT